MSASSPARVRAPVSGAPHASPNNLQVASPHRYNTRSRSPSPAPPSPGGAPRSPSATLTRSLAKMQIAPGAGAAASAPVPSPKPARQSTTALVYDDRCLLHQANYSHVEKPARASVTMDLLKSSGLYSRCVHIPSRMARDDEIIGQAHTKEHVDKINGSAHLDYGSDELDSETEGDTTLYPDCKFLDSDTYVNRHSATAAKVAIGGLIELIEAVLRDDVPVRNGFAVIRPPGHHAATVKASGFCLYNNVAVAAQAIRAKYPNLVRKVVVVDFDVHHGDGSQSIFYDDPHVLYMSIHRYQGGAFYPHTGAHTDCGGPHAPGSNVNIPLNHKGMGDREYMTIVHTVLAPIIREFQPDLMLLSAGFDCAQGDPLGGMEVSSEGFAHITRALMEVMQSPTGQPGRVVMALEGGYNVRAVSEGVAACVRTLLGDPLPPLEDPHAFLGKREISKLQQKRDLFLADLDLCVAEQRKYWKCMQKVQPLAPPSAASPTAPAATPAQLQPAATPAAATPAPTVVVKQEASIDIAASALLTLAAGGSQAVSTASSLTVTITTTTAAAPVPAQPSTAKLPAAAPSSSAAAAAAAQSPVKPAVP